MQILWDEPKRQANLVKHGSDFADLDTSYFAMAVIRPARSPRWFAFGDVKGRLHSVLFQPLGREAVSVISMRAANQKERVLYEQAKGI